MKAARPVRRGAIGKVSWKGKLACCLPYYTPSGAAVATFSLAVNKSWTGQDGQKQDKTTWFRVTTWRKQAEIVSQYLTKGQRVLVVGEIEDPYIFTAQDGTPRASLQVTALTVRFLNSRGEGGGSFNAPVPTEAPPEYVGEEDIPF